MVTSIHNAGMMTKKKKGKYDFPLRYITSCKWAFKIIILDLDNGSASYAIAKTLYLQIIIIHV